MLTITKEINPGSFSLNTNIKLVLEYIKWECGSDTLNDEELRVAYYLKDDRIFDFLIYKSKLYINPDVIIEMRVDFLSEEHGVLNFREDISFEKYTEIVRYVNVIKRCYDIYLEHIKTESKNHITINI